MKDINWQSYILLLKTVMMYIIIYNRRSYRLK